MLIYIYIRVQYICTKLSCTCDVQCICMQMLHTGSIAAGVNMYQQNAEGSSQGKTRASGSMDESLGEVFVVLSLVFLFCFFLCLVLP